MKTLSKLLLGAAASIVVSSGASAQNLFSDMVLEDQTVANQVQLDGQIRSRQVAMDSDIAAQFFGKRKSADTIKMSLFPGRQITLKRTGFDRNLGEGARNWSGRVEGFEDGFATLVYAEGRVTGHIQYGGETYRITGKENGVHVISELSLAHLPAEEPLLMAPKDDGKFIRSNMDRSPSAWSPRIQIAVFYTPKAAAEALMAGTTAKDEARLAVAMANSTYVNTNLRGKFLKFAGMRSTYCGYDEDTAGGYVQPLYDIRDPATCIGARALTFRNNRNADMVALVRKSGGGCGVGFYAPTPGNPNSTYSLTSRNCIPGHTFTHELGHNMGLNHDRHTAGDLGGNQDLYNYGLALPDATTPIRSVMAYNNACSVVGKSCTRVPLFTNARKGSDWNGTNLGRGLHAVDPALSRKKLIDNWDVIAGYR